MFDFLTIKSMQNNISYLGMESYLALSKYRS